MVTLLPSFFIPEDIVSAPMLKKYRSEERRVGKEC